MTICTVAAWSHRQHCTKMVTSRVLAGEGRGSRHQGHGTEEEADTKDMGTKRKQTPRTWD